MSHKAHKRGTHRVSSPEETRARVWPLLRSFGITRVANITGLDCIGIPVVAVYRPNSRSLSVAQGKGLTLTAAEVSGIMESIEFHHAENISEPLVLGSYEQLRGTHPLIDPELLPKSAVGRWSHDTKVPFIAGVDLLQESTCFVPYELVHTDFTLPFPQGSGCFSMGSNGLASGNHLLEAVAHGLSEVVERDAVTLFSLLPEERRAGRRVDPATVDDVECRALLARLAEARVSVVLFELTSDIRIPAFRAIILDTDLNPDRPVAPSTGTGCHPSRGIALARALTEAAQSRLTVIAGSRDDLPRERYRTASELDELRARRERLLAAAAPRAFEDAPTFDSDDLAEDVAWSNARVADVGMRHVVVVDLTKPEIGIPVARVIVPGLEPARDVPGWVPGPRARAILAGSAA